MAWTAALAPRKQATRWIDQGLWILLGALLGGRLAHVVFAWPYYMDRLMDIPQVWLGGLSGVGALGGSLLAIGLVAVLTRQDLGALADGYLPLAAALVVSAWLASWLDGSAYGAETTAWWGLPARDEWGVFSRRAPLQMAAACLALVVFWVSDRSRDSHYPGQAASLAFSGVSVLILAVSLLRADPSPTWVGLRPDSWVSWGFALFSAGVFYLSRRRGRRPGSSAETDIFHNTS